MDDVAHAVTVVMRSHNDAALLPHTLGALDAQEGVQVRLFVFESASTDGSREVFERHGYDRIVHLLPGTYHSATVLNQGAEWAETELVAFVNSDAIMMSRHVLRRLADAIVSNKSCAGAFCKQIPRPDATPMTRLDYFTAFENRHELGPLGRNMSLVCSMIRRSVWRQNPFDPALTFAEDYVWSHGVRRQGWTLRYVPEAVVEHSHNYASDELYRRHFGDAAALSSIRPKAPTSSPVTGVLLPWTRRCLRDTWRLARMGALRDAWQLPTYRWPMLLGEWHGTRAGWAHFREQARTDPQPIAPRL
jgi:rhamnosyltransferase